MKKLICFAVLVILVTIAAIVPKKIRESRNAYEARMVAVLAAIKEQFRAVSSGESVSVEIFAPVIDREPGTPIVSVTGIVDVKSLGGRQYQDVFTAKIRNDCTSVYAAGCLQVQSLEVTGKVTAQADELVFLLPSLPFKAPTKAAIAENQIKPETAAKGSAKQEPVTAEIQAETTPTPETKREPVGNNGADEPHEKSDQATDRVDKAEPAKASELGTETADAEDKGSIRAPREPTAEPERTEAQPKPAEDATEQQKQVADSSTGRQDEEDQYQGAEEARTAMPSAPPPSFTRRGSSETELAARFSSASPRLSSFPEAADSPNRVLRIQLGLKRFGYDPGPADNLVGEKTRSAILEYQRQNGLDVTGEPSLELLRHILARSSASQAQTAMSNGDGPQTSNTERRTETATLAADTSNRIAQIQQALESFGYDTGGVDNVVGYKTRAAIIAYQRRNGLEPTGEPTQNLLNHILGSTNQSNTP